MAKNKRSKSEMVKKDILKNGVSSIDVIMERYNINAYQLSRIIANDAELSSLVNSTEVVKQLLTNQLLEYLSNGIKEVKNIYTYKEGVKTLVKTEEKISRIAFPILYQFLKALDESYTPVISVEDDIDGIDDADVDDTLIKLIEARK